jgi:AcrR family transcriptional regulator
MTTATLTFRQAGCEPRAGAADRTRRQHAIDAAAHVFARRGYHGAGTRAIADLLGIKVASLYFHFRSKEEALEEVCRVGLEEPIIYLRTALATQPTFEERVCRFLESYSAHLGRQSDHIFVFLNERRYLSAEAAVRLNDAARGSASVFERLFEEARAEGVMDPAISNRMARLILIGVLNNITQLRLNGPIADFESFVRHSGEHFVRGMGPVQPTMPD